MSRLTASRAAVDLIASFEGFRARAARTPDGRWTLGFGHVATAREGLTVTRAEAEDLLRWDLRPVEDMIRQSALTPLNQNQFDALVSFAFNIGLSNFATSDVLSYLNQGQPIAAALAMHAWRRAKVNGRVLVVDALVRRRAAEAALFLEPLGPRPAAPTSVLTPQIDYAAALLSHASDPRAVALSVGEDGATIETAPVPVSNELALHGEAQTSMPPQTTDNEISPIAPWPVEELEAVAKTEIKPDPMVKPEPAQAERVVEPDVRSMPLLPDEESLEPAPLDPEPTLASVISAEKGQSISVPRAQMREAVPGPVPANGTAPVMPTPANDGPVQTQNQPSSMQPAPWSAAVEGAGPDLTSSGIHIVPPGGDLVEKKAGPKRLTWGLLALGAILMAGGLWFAHLLGILPPDPEGQKVTLKGLFAAITACFGFVILVTSAVALAGGEGHGDEADLMR